MGWDNNIFFSSSNSLDCDFGEERIVGDDYDKETSLLDIDPYIGKVFEKTTGILDKEEKYKKQEFKSVEINGQIIEYQILTENLLNFDEASKQARSIGARLPSEEEFDSIFEAIGAEEFTKNFPGVLYCNSEKTIGSEGQMIYFWLKELSGTDIKVKVIFELDPNNIHDCIIGKQYGICSMFVK